MCVSAPKTPKVEPIPDRRASVLPDGGDPTIAMSLRKRHALMPSLMIFANQSTLGAPQTSGTGT